MRFGPGIMSSRGNTAAKAYKQEYYHPAMMGLFLSIFAGEIYVPRWEVYGCFVVQFENPAYYEVFQNLRKGQ